MGMRINNNNVLNTAHILGRNTNRLTRGLEKLASGLRINRARDDAAGLAISQQLEALQRQLEAETNNLQGGYNAGMVAEGAMEGQTEALQRIRELAVQAGNGTLSPEQRAALNQEAQQLAQQIEQTAQNTEFNGTKLLNGAQGQIDLGVEGGAALTTPNTTTAALGVNGLDLTTQAGAQAAMGAVDHALEQLGQARATIGAEQNRFESAIANRENQGVNIAEANSRIRDLDYARATAEQARLGILQQTGIAAMAQGNLSASNVLRLLG